VVGETLGHYRLIELLGAGSMGEVYLAEDKRLNRKVAVKLLPAQFASDPQRLARFEQEARAAAALNHPHIAVVHDVGSATDAKGATTHFIVQEYLEGESLGTGLASAALPVRRAVTIAAEVGEALVAAHAAGIIHRDLKPDNIFLTAAGHAKVLDFGLAKLGEAAAPEAGSPSMSPTILDTVAGQVMGTAGYMAPEQIEASGDIDERADLFSLGCVIYEMVTGCRAFAGKSIPDTLSQVLHEEPARLRDLGTNIPAELQRIVRKCLTKERARRYQHADEVTVDLLELRARIDAGTTAGVGDIDVVGIASQGGKAATASAPGRVRGLATVATAIVLTALVTALVTRGLSGKSGGREAMRFEVETGAIDVFGAATPVVVSPDGQTIVYVSIAGGETRLMARALDAFAARPLSDTEDAQSPFFSPDGQWVGFFASNEMRKVPISGGSVQTICALPTVFSSAAWGRNGTIVFAMWSESLGLFEVAEDGGEPVEILPVDPITGADSRGYLNPQVLDSGDVLFQAQSAGAPMFLLRSGATMPETLGANLTMGARYVPSGHLLWVDEGSLIAAPIDLDAFALTAPPVVVVENVFAAATSAFDVSDAGTLAYIEGTGDGPATSIVAVDRSGEVTRLVGSANQYVRPTLSPDGYSVLVGERDPDRGVGLFIYDLSRGGRRRLTTSGQPSLGIWSADGQGVMYTETGPDGRERLLRRAADGSGEGEQLRAEQPTAWWPTGVSSDGHWLAFYVVQQQSSRDIWLMDLTAPEHSVQELLATTANERSAVFSPDNRWLAYVSDASSRDEVYVMPAPPATGPSIPVSTTGGREPVWSHDGRELFFRRGDQMIRVPLGEGEGFEPGGAEVLFTGTFAVETGGRNQYYGVTPDGERFIMVTPHTDASRIKVVVNWLDGLRRRATGR